MSQTKSMFYKSLNAQLASLLSGETNLLTNLSQFSAFIFNSLEDINWAGFYLTQPEGDLLLGPFQGNVACTRIQSGKGVCGTAASTREIQIVADVDQFAGHISCDSRSRSEIVLPILLQNGCYGVLDIDSPKLVRFDQADAQGLRRLIMTLIESTDW